MHAFIIPPRTAPKARTASTTRCQLLQHARMIVHQCQEPLRDEIVVLRHIVSAHGQQSLFGASAGESGLGPEVAKATGLRIGHELTFESRSS